MEIRKLNTLRGLAALIVFVTHFSDATKWLDGILGGRAGQYGVMLFFLLSGFLMAHLYMDKPLTRANIKNYLVARAGRILPLYLLVVFGSYLLNVTDIGGLYDIADGKTVVAHLLFLYGESVLWTIGPEVQFYCLFIGLWAWFANRRGYIYVFSIAIIIVLFFTNVPRIFGDLYGFPYNFFFVLRSLPYFFVGLILGIHYKSFKVPDYLHKHWFVLTLLLIPLMYPEFSPVTAEARYKMWLSYEVLLVMTSIFFCVVFLVPNNNILLANRLGDFLGKISYGLYLLHFPIIQQINKLDMSVEGKLIWSFGLSILCAYIVYQLFERPIAQHIRKKFILKT